MNPDDLLNPEMSYDATRPRQQFETVARHNKDNSVSEFSTSFSVMPTEESQWREKIEAVTHLKIPENRQVILTDTRYWGDPTNPQVYAKFKVIDRPNPVGTVGDLDTVAILKSLREGRDLSTPIYDGESTFVLSWNDWQVGKALSDDTPVLTTEGWMKHGEIRPGDYVYGPDGLPKEVLQVTGSSLQDVYSVNFDHGVSIVATGDHLWEGYKRVKVLGGKYAGYQKQKFVMSTNQIASGNLWKRSGFDKTTFAQPFQVDLPSPVFMSEKNLPVDPYILGMWLGDGNRCNGYISLGEADREMIEGLGKPVPSNCLGGMFGVNVTGLSCQLRVMGLIKNKHIPEEYLYSSIDQRLSLLQGLMDTDGDITVGGLASFNNTNPSLTDGIEWILTSLGYKFSTSDRIGKLNGVEKLPFRRITFNARSSMNPFRLTRKAERVIEDIREEQRYRFIQSIESAGQASAQCLTVDGSLYLAGYDMVLTHNCENGGTRSIIERVDAALDLAVERAKELRKINRGLGRLVILGGGDMLEGCFIFPNQSFQIDLDRRSQINVASTMILDGIDRLAPYFARVDTLVVPGNHGENRAGGHKVNNFDNDDCLVFEIAAKATERDSRLSHVKHHIAQDEIAKTLEVNGWILGTTHGQAFGKNPGGNAEIKAQNWLKGQKLGDRAIGNSDVFVTHHFHHEFSRDWGKTFWVQTPAMDGGSQHFTDFSGLSANPGMLSFVMNSQQRYTDAYIL